MKTLLFNLPFPTQIIRRYMCSYNSPSALFPPHELISIGGTVRQSGKGEVVLLDAVAEKKNIKKCLENIKSVNPDIIISLTGIECIEYDLKTLDHIKKHFPQKTIIAFGYYPTLFAKEILRKTKIDFLLLNEPELSFCTLYDCLDKGNTINEILGIAYRQGKEIRINPGVRIKDLDAIGLPAHNLISSNRNYYSEVGLGGPIAVIQTSRGCPFPCNYCIRTYGREIFYRSAESVVNEIEEILALGIKKIRFLDDTFNVNKKRLNTMLDQITKKNLKFRWSCLSRVDTLERSTILKMRNTGCERIFIGVESGSQKVLDYFNKKYKANEIIDKVRIIKKIGIESVGFFLVGAPVEGEEDLQTSIKLAKTAGFDYIIVTKLTPYPGTDLFKKLEDKINFNLLPYYNDFSDKYEQEILQREKTFYRQYYFSWQGIVGGLKLLCKNPRTALRSFFSFIKFLIVKNPVKKHPDYL